MRLASAVTRWEPLSYLRRRGRSNLLAGKETCAERRLKVVPADRPVQIEHLACEVQARHELALHRARVHLVKRNAAGGHFGFFEPERAGDRNHRSLEAVDQRRSLRAT